MVNLLTRAGLLILLVMLAITLIAKGGSQLIPAGPQIICLVQPNGQWPTVMALDVDRNLAVYFDPNPVLDGTLDQWALSPDGRFLTFKNTNDLMRMDVNGSNQQWLTQGSINNPSHTPVWSPDGTRIAFVSGLDFMSEIYVMDADGNNTQRLTSDEISDDNPAWSPDGKHIAFLSYPGTTGSVIKVIDADGGNERPLTSTTDGVRMALWSPDGQYILFRSGRDGDADIYVMDADGSHQTPLTFNDADDYWPMWSPDGRQIVFTSNQDANYYGLYLMNADGSDQHLLVRNEGYDDLRPSWSPDGKYIMFEVSDMSSYQIDIINADGSHLRPLQYLIYYPVWFRP